MLKQILNGHTSPETAFVVEDYPYGFTLRCKIRYWVEYKKGKGFRFCSQTTKPKKSFEVWNKPKQSTYSFFGVMGFDDVGHVQFDSLSGYDIRKLPAFVKQYEGQIEGIQKEFADTVIKYLKEKGELFGVEA